MHRDPGDLHLPQLSEHRTHALGRRTTDGGQQLRGPVVGERELDAALGGNLLVVRGDPAELDDAIREMIAYDGPFILDVLVEKHENCFPMIPSGKPHNEMLLGDMEAAEDIGTAIQSDGAVLV